MAIRTSSQCFYAITHSKVTDNFDIRVSTTPQINEAFVQILKCTTEEAFMKIDSFIVGGLAGVLALQGQNKQVRTRTEIRDIVMRGFSKSFQWPMSSQY